MKQEEEKIIIKHQQAINCKKFIDKLVKANYYGYLKLKFENGHIFIGEKQDNIKFDDKCFDLRGENE